ncbi:ABC transporter permease [Gemmatimonadota bacterium]
MRFLVTFFLRNGIHSRRTLWMAILGLFPVGCAMLLWLAKPLLQEEGVSLFGLFPDLGLLLFLDLLLPLMAIFVGTAVIADEVEERTLAYLITRPVPRRTIVLAKLTAGFITLAVIMAVSLFLTYTVLVLDEGTAGLVQNQGLLLKCEGVLLLGVLAYLPLFALSGGLIKRPVLFGLIFAFGWERLVAFMPGNIRLTTVLHYLHQLFPVGSSTSGGGGLRDAILGAIPGGDVSDGAAVAVLIIIAAGLTFLTTLLLKKKEYSLEQGE